MSDLQDIEPEGSKLKSIADGAATGVGKILQWTGYGVGRASPIVASAATSVAGTKTAQFVYDNFKQGFDKGWDAHVEAKARRQARQWMASADMALRTMGEDLLAQVARWKEGGQAAPA